MKIVVRVPNWIGDSVLAFPALESLSKNYPKAQIWIATREWAKDLFTSFEFIEGTILLSNQTDLKSSRNSAKKLKEYNFDIGLLLANSFYSALIFYLAKIPQRWGYSKDGRGLLLTRRATLKNQEKPLHQVNYYLNLISSLGLQTFPPEIFLPLTKGEKQRAKELLSSLDVDLKKPFITINPGAAYGSAKRWPARKFAELALLLQERKNTDILVIGSSDEVELAESISSFMTKKPLNLAGKTNLRLLAGLISLSSLFITNDSGPMHLANALKVPIVAIFGPTDPHLTGPFQGPAAIIKEEVPCWPCSYRECPFDHRCMTAIDSEEVFEASQNFL